jgi:hypothetical protein
LDNLLKKLSEIIINIIKIEFDEITDCNYNYNNNNLNIIICDACKLLETIIKFIEG